MQSLLLLTIIAGADPAPQTIYPKSVVVQPETKPSSAVPLVLTKEVIFVIASDTIQVITTSPAGMIKVTPEVSQLRIKGRFIDNPTVVETKNFAQKYIYTVEPAATGKCEVLFWPKGGEEKDIVRIATSVNDGTKPIPPPVPPPVPTDFDAKLKAAFTADGATPESLARYAALYRNAAKSTVLDPGIPTGAALLAEMQTAVKLIGIPHGSMDRTARVIADKLNPMFAKTTALDQATRDKIATTFAEIAVSLEELK